MIRCSRLGRKSGEHDSLDGYESSKLNPWRRSKEPYFGLVYVTQTINPSQDKFSCFNDNQGLSVYTKRAAFKVSPSVVSLISYSRGKQAFWCSGVIFACFWNTDSFSYYVLTSATLLKPPTSHGCDNDILNIHSRNLVLRPLDDSLALNKTPTNVQASANRFPYPPAKLIPGDVVIVVGRYVKKPFQIMETPGKYRCVQLQSCHTGLIALKKTLSSTVWSFFWQTTRLPR
ncbi:hypothetical protein LIER_35913 [Lithospermum erythrorhizon]|uniref:Uncharacterized protein n=1 Tax=Lithospermum erythrorhizon TaxID=34254 RepID=A0AAV3NZD5_LITER